MQDSQLSKSPRQSKKASPSAGPVTHSRDSEKCQILAKKGFLTAPKVISGLVLLVHSQEFQLGVLLHLPTLSNTSGRGASRAVDSQDEVFAKSAVAMILAEFESLGVSRSKLSTYVIGGSATDTTPEVAKLTVRRALWNYGLSLTACDLGGKQVRSIWLDVETGRTIIRSESMLQNVLPIGAPMPVAS